MDENVINFSSARESIRRKELEAACRWFVTNYNKDKPLENIAVSIKNDELLRKEGYKQLIFTDGEIAIWVRLWGHPGFKVVSYTANIVANYSELLEFAPKSLAEMLKNGVQTYRQGRLYV